MTPGTLVRDARMAAGLTQAQLAERLHTTQSAVARLESGTSNPRVETLARTLRACDRELSIDARPRHSSIDETLVAERLQVSPGERLKSFEQSYANLRGLALAGARSRGEMA